MKNIAKQAAVAMGAVILTMTGGVGDAAAITYDCQTADPIGNKAASYQVCARLSATPDLALVYHNITVVGKRPVQTVLRTSTRLRGQYASAEGKSDSSGKITLTVYADHGVPLDWTLIQKGGLGGISPQDSGRFNLSFN